MLRSIESLDIHRFTDADSLIEEYDLLFSSKSAQWVRNLYIHFEFDDLTELSNRNIVRDMEAEEEFSQQLLFVDHLCVNRFDNDGEHWWMFETEIFELNFSLSYKKMIRNRGYRFNGLLTEWEKFLVVVDSFTGVCSLSYLG